MQPIAAVLSARDSADLAAYYSMLPTFPDPQDNRSFPQAAPDPAQTNRAALLVALGGRTARRTALPVLPWSRRDR